MPPSSRTLARRCSSLLRDSISFLRYAGQLPDLRDLPRRDEAAAQQPAFQQLRASHSASFASSPSRHVLHMPGAGQQHLQLAADLAEGMEHRLPVNPGGLHRDMGDALGRQPRGHLTDTPQNVRYLRTC